MQCRHFIIPTPTDPRGGVGDKKDICIVGLGGEGRHKGCKKIVLYKIAYVILFN